MTKIFRTASARITNLLDGQQIEVRGLRIVFDITKTTKAGDNKGKVKIYNLNQASRGLIQSATDKSGKPNTQIELRVGYVDEEEKLLFVGTGEVQNTYGAPDWITSIEVNDGLDKLSGFTFERKFPAGTSISNIVTGLLGNGGITTAISAAFPGILPKARTFSGDPIKQAQDLASTFGFTLDIQNNEAIVTPKDVPVNNKYKTRLDSSTGLINTPTVKGNLIICEALINPDLAPNNFVELASNNLELQGNYIIQKADYKGDNWGGPWTVKLEMKFVSVIDPTDRSNLIITSEVLA